MEEDSTDNIPLNEQFMEGSIFRVKLKNFLTHADAEFYPGPRLNVVIGPNGSGKSSIVCAIAIGLAGNLKVLERAEKIADFVQHQKTFGYIEIELFFKSGNKIIRRDIHKESNKSTWKLNGRDVAMKVITALMKKSAIQIDNLCQFLPQDKVSAFSHMNAVQLLKATEQAIGDGELAEIHEQLMQWKKDFGGFIRDVEAAREELTSKRTENEYRCRDVERLEEHRNRMEETELLLKKALWAKVKLKAKEQEDAVAAKRDSRDKCEQVQRELVEPLMTSVDKVQASNETAAGKLHEATDSKKAAEEAMKRLKLKIDEFESKQAALQGEIQAIRDNRKQMEKRLEKNKNKRQITQEAMGNMDDPETTKKTRHDLKEQSSVIENQIRSHKRQLEEEQEKYTDILNRVRNKESKLNHLNDAILQKRHKIRELDAHAYKALEWIDAHRHAFTRKVWGPIALEINVPNREHSDMVEAAFGMNKLTSFATECREDYSTLMKYSDDNNVKITVFTVENGEYRSTDRMAPALLNNLSSQYGIQGVLADCMEAPDIVMEVLADANKHLVGTRKTQEEMLRNGDKVTEDCLNGGRHTLILLPGETRNSVRSLYGQKNIVTTTGKIYKSRLLGSSSDNNGQEREALEFDLQGLRAEHETLQKRIASMKSEQRPLEVQQHELKTQLARVKDVERSHLKFQRKLIELEHLIESLQVELSRDVAGEEDALVRKMQNHQSKYFTNVMKVAEKHEVILKFSQEHSMLSLNHKASHVILSTMERQLRRVQGRVDEYKRTYNEKKQLLSQIKKDLKSMERKAEKEAPLDDYLERFASLPEDYQIIASKIATNQAITESFRGDLRILDQYEKCKTLIAELEVSLAEKETRYQEVMDNIESHKDPWHKKLSELVETINASFSKYFHEMGCVGEVELDDSSEDISKWGIIRRAQFRQSTKLATMNAQEQSGGEKSVGTIMYMMALQSLTDCPFRVVDEINQGMDPINERKVFDRITKTSCGAKLPQYFLITPKLITGLEFHYDCKVLFIFNGPYCMTQEDWDVQKFCDKNNGINQENEEENEAKRLRIE